MKPSILALLAGALYIAIGCNTIVAQETKQIYKSTKERELEVFINKPADWNASDKRPAIVFFSGGGWRSNSNTQFKPQAEFFAQKGFVSVRADYRVRNRDKVLPDKCVEDAISAVRWVRANAKTLGVDPDRIVALGGSAGGHMALCTFLSDDINAPGEDISISGKPNAIVVFNPAVDLTEFPGTKDAYFIQAMKESELKRLSPTYLLTKTNKMPPTLIIDGMKDRFYPQIQVFEKKAKSLGSPVDAIYVEGRDHGFFNRSPFLEQTNEMIATYLSGIGFMPKQTPASRKITSAPAATKPIAENTGDADKIFAAKTGRDGNTQEDLYQCFIKPDRQAKPICYWFWHGNRVTAKEAIREIGLFKQAGLGGVQIFPYGVVRQNLPGYPALLWGGPEWCEVVKATCLEAKRQGMTVDLLMGVGWPYGGSFIKPEHYAQRIITGSMPVRGDGKLTKNVKELMETRKNPKAWGRPDHRTESIQFIRLVPKGAKDTSEILSLENSVRPDGTFDIPVKKGVQYQLMWGVRQQGFLHVTGGTPGTAGPALDHFNAEATRAYLEKIRDIERQLGQPLNELFRALCCDSLELDYANWSTKFSSQFKERYGYDIEPWYPFIFLAENRQYPAGGFASSELDELAARVRFDFNRMVIDNYLSGSAQILQDFCREKGVIFRLQSYGFPQLLGMPEGYLIPDVPEGNTWLFSNMTRDKQHLAPYDSEAYEWNDGHGYLTWNKYAAAGGHLRQRPIISCETMTNTVRNYDASLEDIKQSDDMTFITGMNHAVCHVFNFSPPEAGFPGWLRYTTFFSEHNTWWKYLPKWTEYNARISGVLQRTRPVMDIAVMGPEYEIWAAKGFDRTAFHITPFYLHHLWETLSNLGSSCDYLGQGVLEKAFDAEQLNTQLHFPYKVLVLTDVNRITMKVCTILESFVGQGGKLVIVGKMPSATVSMAERADDSTIRSRMESLLKNNPEKVFHLAAPEKDGDLLAWTSQMLTTIGERPRIEVLNPVSYAYQTQHTYGDQQLCFFSNSNRKREVSLQVRFPDWKKLTPWIWNTDTGERRPLEIKNGIATLTMAPLKSMLVVFDRTPAKTVVPAAEPQRYASETMTLTPTWNVRFLPVNNKKPFEKKMGALVEYTTDPDLLIFAGDAIYSCSFDANKPYAALDLGDVNRCITQVTLNGKDLGVVWYGQHRYDISGALRQGRNELTIRYTTLVKNYIISMPKAERPESANVQPKPSRMGLVGPVKLLEAAK